MIDLHCHVLPGIDDGPATIDGSLSLARVAAAAGIETLVATPHVSSRYRNDHATIAPLVDELNERLQAEQIGLRVRPGAEIALTRVAELQPAALAQLGLGGGSCLLIEPPFASVLPSLPASIRELQLSGYRVLLAHPERCRAFHRDPQMLASLVGSGVLTSITAGSLVGAFGADVRRFAIGLLAQGLAHNVTSDAHDDSQRAPGIAEQLARVGYEPLTDWLTRAVPAAILAGEDIPERPADVRESPSRGPRRWRLRR